MDREVDAGHSKGLLKCEALKGKLPYLAQGHLPSEDWGAEVVPGGWMDGWYFPRHPQPSTACCIPQYRGSMTGVSSKFSNGDGGRMEKK